jgi:hypothetical protein
VRHYQEGADEIAAAQAQAAQAAASTEPEEPSEIA